MNILNTLNISALEFVLFVLLIVLFVCTAIAIHVIRRNQPKKKFSILDENEDDNAK